MFRYVKGFKCVGYCQYKRFKRKKAKDEIYRNSTRNRNGDITSLHVDGMKTKKLIKLYEDYKFMDCSSISEWDVNSKLIKMLEENIADRQLLEVEWVF